MKYTLQVDFSTDDFDSDEGELVEQIRHGVENVISELSETYEPMVKIWEKTNS